MYGSDIGTLRVYQINSTQVQQTPIWSVVGNKGQEWLFQAINLSYQNDHYRILFEGVRGGGTEGDIAVDDINISNIDVEDISSRCEPPDSDQCQMTTNSNDQHSIDFIEECKEAGKPLNFSSCSRKYLTVESFIFDPVFEFDICIDTYVQFKQSLCTTTNDSSICTVDIHGFIKNNPECFRRYSMIIDYACEENLTPVSRSQQKSDTLKVTGIAVGVSIGCGIIASIVIIIIYSIRRLYRNKKESIIHQQNNHIGSQGVALPQNIKQRSDQIELIGGITNKQHYHDITTPSNVTDDEYSYTYLDSINNPSYKYTNGRKVGDALNKTDLSNHTSNKKTNHNLVMSNGNMRGKNVLCKIVNVPNRSDGNYNITTSDNEYAHIDPSEESSDQVKTSGTSTSENYVVLDPNETGFNRQGNPTVEIKNISYKPETNANENRLVNDTNNQITTEGTYDLAGTSLHTDNTNTIYNHTVDDVYDTSSHRRKGREREDTYDHFPGQKTDDDYDIMKFT